MIRHRARSSVIVDTAPSRHVRSGRSGLPIGLAVFLAGACLGAADAAGQRPPRGYVPTACSFDLDDDGVRGEPAEDCRLCDGTTTDPDGDGIPEDLIYVAAQDGSDATGSGAPGNPYRTLAKAFAEADGPGDGAEDIVCFRGIAAESDLTPLMSGVPGTKVLPRAGSQARDFELPTNPSMLVGWDFDGDGCYPPYDDGVTDVAACGSDADVAVLDGTGLDRAFELADWSTNSGLSYFEMAHLEARNYGFQTAAVEDIGFVRFGRGDASTHLYLHDLELDSINRGKELSSSAIVFDLFVGEMLFAFVAVENVESLDTGAYFARGTTGGINVDGPLRFQSISYTGFGCDQDVCGATGSGATVTGFKIWGVADGFEVLDSVFDAQTAAWDPRPNGPVNGVIPNACTRDWVIRNNEFRDWGTALAVKGAEGACGIRPTDDVLFDGNVVIVQDATNWDTGTVGVALSDDGTSSVERSIGDVTVINNVFDAAPDVGWRRLLSSAAGNDVEPGPGTVIFSGNTIRGAPTFGGWAFIHVIVGESASGGPVAHPIPRFRFENNLFTGLDGGNDDDRLIYRFDYAPTELVMERNAIHTAGTFRWLAGPILTDLGAWRAATGLDTTSRSCNATLATSVLGDLHLDPSDTCAQNIGGDLSAWTDDDIDLDQREHGPSLEAGADEIPSSIFADGFESGDTAAWSSVTAGAP